MLAVGRGMMIATFLLNIDLVQDKAMMERWGLGGMQSFEQKGVRAKERGKISDQACMAAEHGTPASVAEM
jgi:Tfp pilus assembly ATPase PilU